MLTGKLVPARLPSSSVALSVRNTTVCASTRDTASTRRTAATSARFDIFHQESSRLTGNAQNPTPSQPEMRSNRRALESVLETHERCHLRADAGVVQLELHVERDEHGAGDVCFQTERTADHI